MPLTSFQSEVLRALATQRSPESFVAGGVAINRDGPRYSNDIDIFNDSEARLQASAAADADALAASGFAIVWKRKREGKRDAVVSRGAESMALEWVTDSDFRFFPAQADETFGYVLHPVDLATNKAAAAADRREPRDIVDLLTLHESLLPLGAIVCAAVGRFPGATPEEMLADIVRHSRFSEEEFRALATASPIEAQALQRRIRAMIESAETFIAALPSQAVGFVFLDADRPVQPELANLDKYRRVAGSRGGIWPSSPEISRAMLETYRDNSRA